MPFSSIAFSMSPPVIFHEVGSFIFASHIFSASLSINIVWRERSWYTLFAYPICRSACLCVSGKCAVAKWMTRSRCRLGWEVGLVEVRVYYMGTVMIVVGEGAVLGVNVGLPNGTNGDFVA